MAKSRPTSNNGTTRETDEALRTRGFNPFLRPEHVKEGDTLALTGFNYPHRDGSQTCVTVQKGDTGEQFTLGVRKGSPDHRAFFEAFGTNDPDKWAPGFVTVTIGKGTRPGADVFFVNVKTVTAR